MEEAVCAVAVSTVRYLRRRFQEWEATLGAEEVADRVFLEGQEQNAMQYSILFWNCPMIRS